MVKVEWDDRQKLYKFETEELKGTIDPGGQFMGVRSLIHKKEGREWVGIHNTGYPPYGIKPGDRLFVLDLYHFYTSNVGYLGKARDLKYEATLEDCKITSILHPSEKCNITTTLNYEVKESNIIDFTIKLQPHTDYEMFEAWASSYLSTKMAIPFVYVKKEGREDALGRFYRPVEEGFLNGYACTFPRNNSFAHLTWRGGDGKMQLYSPYLNGPYLHRPIIVSINTRTGYGYVEMCQEEECARIVTGPYGEPAGGANYANIYFTLFGRDIKADETLTCRFRALVTDLDYDPYNAIPLYARFEADEKGEDWLLTKRWM